MTEQNHSDPAGREHHHGGKSEQEARSEGEHGWGYGGRTEEERQKFVDEDEPKDQGSHEEPKEKARPEQS